MSDAGTAAESEQEYDMARAYRVLGVVGLTSFQTAMALSIIFVIFSDLARSFPDASPATLSWVVSIYTIVGAATLVMGGALSERYGRKRILLIGATIFAISSGLSAVAPSVGLLIAARVLQAIGSSMSLPVGAALIMREFPPERRGTAIGIWFTVGSVAAAMGPSLGGLIVDAGGWRWAFGLNVPLGVVALVVGWFVLEESYGDRDDALPDPVGAALLLVGIIVLVLGVVQSDDWGWGSPSTLGCLVVGTAVLALVAWRSLTHPKPILRMDLFRTPSFGLGNTSVALYATSFFGFQLVAIQFLTNVWGYSIRDAGLLSTPVFALSGATTALSGRLNDRFGHRAALVPGGIMWTVGMLALMIGIDGSRNVTLWLVAACIAGAGSGFLWGGIIAVTLRDLGLDSMGIGASMQQTVQRIGNAFGIALAVTFLGGSLELGDGSTIRAALAFVVVTGVVGIGAGVAIGRAQPPVVVVERSGPGSEASEHRG